ncbi:MAG TPA: hypothetical protein GYA08_22360 [Chloroflexi bacterium]|nr:hypothetical protein [Chloroflexota bacterium]
MVVGSLPLDLGALLIVAVVLAALWTLRTLFRYFLGGNKPLQKHIEARIEANKKPEEVRDAAEEYERIKLKRGLISVLVIILLVWWYDRALLDEIAVSLWNAIQFLAGALGQLLTRIAATLSR